MTRSMAFVLATCAPIVAAGCAEPAAPRREPAPAKPSIATADHRAEAKWSPPGDDVTELVREQNVPGSEPPAPTRHGVARPTDTRPVVTKTQDGFLAHIPGAMWVPTPAHYEGHIVVGGFGTYEVHSFNVETGSPRGASTSPTTGPPTPPVKDGICVFNTYSCTMFGVEVATGKPLWSWYLGSPQLATPIIQGDARVLVVPRPGRPPRGRPFVVAAFDLKTGAPKWRRWIDAEVNSTPVSDGRYLYVATKARDALPVLRGRRATSSPSTRTASPRRPCSRRRAVIFGRDQQPRHDNDMLATSRVLFPHFEVDERIDASAVKPQPRPLVARHGLYTIDHGVVVATDRRTGHRMWQERLGYGAAGRRARAVPLRGQEHPARDERRQRAPHRARDGRGDGRLRAQARPIASQPIAVDGWLYAGTQAGRRRRLRHQASGAHRLGDARRQTRPTRQRR